LAALAGAALLALLLVAPRLQPATKMMDAAARMAPEVLIIEYPPQSAARIAAGGH